MTKQLMSILIDPWALLDPDTKEMFGHDEIGKMVKASPIRWIERGDKFTDIYEALNRNVPDGIDAHKVTTFESVPLQTGGGEIAYVDEEARLFPSDKAWWIIKGFPEPILGRGLAVGVNREGDDVPPDSALLKTLMTNVRFGIGKKELRFATTTGEVEIREFNVHVLDAWAAEGRIVAQGPRAAGGLETY